MSSKKNAPAATGAQIDQLDGGSADSVARTPLDGALWLVRHGFPVFPVDHPGTPQCTGVGRGHDPATCTDRGKHPCVPFTRAHTLDEDQVRRSIGGKPRNVGVPVGAVDGPDGSRLLVVDSDRPGAIEDAAAAFGQQHTPTMRVRTAKGHHDYYWAPADARLGNGLGALRGRFDGDVRAGNAYVVGPGSVHATGAVYELEDPEQPPVLAPGWLLDALAYTPPPPQRPVLVPRQGTHRGLRALVRFVLDAHEGERNNRLFWAACRAAEGGAENADRALIEAAVAAGLDERAAAATVRSAYTRTGATTR
ncbi:bifunctional DNA primase/polymerase [Streptomyces mexicanus]|uniref:bifunctional DNA primase/polymerase n=1 Tax=Streptomyces mexicanus TaxID=178566 RepID=UPI0031EEA245